MLHILKTKKDPHSIPNMAVLSFAALGVVFGDIGTSPLYTFKTVLALTGGPMVPETILGSLSLILWTLFLITTIKYLCLAMRVDNEGEGGILALMSLLGVKLRPRPIIIAVGLVGAALIYGDGAITPAISVLSAVEGLNIVAPKLQTFVLPISVVILIGLFALQPNGTARIGRAFGPIMALWFLVIGAFGIWGIVRHPTVFVALNPYYGLHYLLFNGWSGFLVLGGVFLCVTGAEALYADMGHFGARPIRVAWLGLVFPSLILNYAGQAALALDGAPISDNIFYRLCPPALMVPFVILSTIATIIASQAIITGAFSMTRQAIQLGWLPRLRITQTSAEGYGQIYVGAVNWILMIITIALTIGFGKSDNLASAYGIAVSATMLATTALLFIAMREVWHWTLRKAVLVAGLFFIIDSTFFAANLYKILEGGYVPIILALFIYAVMYVWHSGYAEMSIRLKKAVVPINLFMEQLEDHNVARVDGTAIFFTHTEKGAPPVMVWHVKQNRALHRHILILEIKTLTTPWLKDAHRLSVTEIASNVWRGTASFGFMEHPDIPLLLEEIHRHNCNIDLSNVTYYLAHGTIVAAHDQYSLPRWIQGSFAFMQHNSLHLSDYFQLPPDQVVELGKQISI